MRLKISVPNSFKKLDENPVFLEYALRVAETAGADWLDVVHFNGEQILSRPVRSLDTMVAV